MKIVNLLILFSLLVIVGCNSKPLYTVEVNNNLKMDVGGVKVFLGENNNRLDFGNFFAGTGKVVGLVQYPKGKTILSYYVGDKEIKKEIDIIGIIPKNQSGSIIINIMENDVVEIKFKNNNE